MTVAAETASAPSLWRQRNFMRFWSAQTISVFGDQISMLALPLAAVLTLDATPAQMGILTALGWLPHLLLSLFAGVWIDARRRRGRIMIVSDLARAGVLATVPLTAWLGGLTIEQLYAVTFAVGVFTVFFDLSYSSYFVAVTPRDQVLDANGKLSTTRAASYVGGPGLAGVLVEVLTAPVAILADACSFLVSALLLGSIRAEEPIVEDANGASSRQRLVEGARFLFGHPILRASVACAATINFFNFVAWAVVILFASRELGLSAGFIGLVFSVGGIGGLVGALVAPRIGRRLGLGPAIVIGSILFPAPLVLFALATGPKWLAVTMLIVGEFLSSVGVMVYDVNGNSLSTLITPNRVRSRVVGVARFANYGTRPLGALAGGVLGGTIGLRPTLWVGVLGALLGVFWLLRSPVPRVRELPEEAA